jgi:hypothetical protein
VTSHHIGNGARRTKEVDVSPARPDPRRREARSALVELQRLVRVLVRHAPVGSADPRRDLAVFGQDASIGQAELRLRAVSALLVTLGSFQQLRSGTLHAAGRDAVTANTSEDATGRTTPATNGTPVNASTAPAEDHTKVAAAAARYIARDLAARQLSEFTSAEGYRLARELARLGRVEEPVERLLAEANKVRLHPMPLVDALSHRSH